ncbi:MAG: alpha/beta fold hydrolase [Bacteroidota bacterium]
MTTYLGCTPPQEESVEKKSPEISFITSDSIEIFGDFYPGQESAGCVLLFHQGGSNVRGEYAGIVPVLQEKGYHILAIDQRTGGQRYGSYNRTVAQFPLKRYSYCDASLDMEAAVEFAQKKVPGSKLILWGSSYSAALAILYAEKYPENVAAVMAFSPASGEPMEGCRPESALGNVKVPLILLRPQSEMESDVIQGQFTLAAEAGHETFTATNGVHGSSMLVESRINSDPTPSWEVVHDFLERIVAEN